MTHKVRDGVHREQRPTVEHIDPRVHKREEYSRKQHADVKQVAPVASSDTDPWVNGCAGSNCVSKLHGVARAAWKTRCNTVRAVVRCVQGQALERGLRHAAERKALPVGPLLRDVRWSDDDEVEKEQQEVGCVGLDSKPA